MKALKTNISTSNRSTRLMRITGCILLCIAVAIFSASCMGGPSVTVEQSAPGPALKVFCSILPVYMYAANVAVTRKNISIEMVMPVGHSGDPRSYTVTSGDQARLGQAGILIINGLGVDAQIEEAAKKARPERKAVNPATGKEEIIPAVKIVDTSSGIETITLKNSPAPNPYVWMSPQCAMVQVKNIEQALYDVDPPGRAEVKTKTDAYLKMLEELDKDYRKLGGGERAVQSPAPEESAPEEIAPEEIAPAAVNPAKIRVITQGDYFDYLARDYGLEIVDTIPSDTGYDEAKIREYSQKLKELGGKVILMKSGRDMAKEKSITASNPVIFLDLLLSGSTYPDFYEKGLKKNLIILQKALDS